MEYQIVMRSGCIEIWVPSTMSSDSLRLIAQRYKKIGTSIVIYKSGHADLAESTVGLLQAQIGQEL